MTATTDAVRDQALEVARGWSGPDAPRSWRLTGALFAELAGDDELLDLAVTIPPQRLPPLLFVASVHRLVIAEPEAALAAYFPGPNREGKAVDDAFALAYRNFCLDRRHALGDLWARRVYQMNEVTRCTQVALALSVVADQLPDRSIALVDVGTGAGFGLYPDRYRYMVDGVPAFGDLASDVHLDCARVGPLAPSHTRLPTIAHRAGLDLNPIDLDDDEARAWFRACLPPERATLRRAERAVAVVRAGDAMIVAGDVEQHLSRLVDGAPPELAVCVVDTYTAVFFDERKRSWMSDLLSTLSNRREIVWISLDPLVPLGTAATHAVHGTVPPALVEENHRGGVFAVLSVMRFGGEPRRSQLLATAHPSGTRMRWLDPATATDPSR